MRVFLEVKSNVFPVKVAEAYEVVEVHMHSFLRDCSKLQHFRAVTKYLETPINSHRVSG